MPEVTLRPSSLPAGHPALTKSGRLRRKARRVLNNRIMRSRGKQRIREGLDRPVNKLVRNTELFYRIADYLELFPESYNQGAWGRERKNAPCGTAFCIAGHAAHETGWLPRSVRDVEEEYDPHTDTYKEIVNFSYDWDDLFRPSEVDRMENRWGPEEVGRGELGLSEAEANHLFAYNWIPAQHLSPSDVLRALGDGAYLDEEISGREVYGTLVIENHQRKTIRTTGKKPKYN